MLTLVFENITFDLVTQLQSILKYQHKREYPLSVSYIADDSAAANALDQLADEYPATILRSVRKLQRPPNQSQLIQGQTLALGVYEQRGDSGHVSFLLANYHYSSSYLQKLVVCYTDLRSQMKELGIEKWKWKNMSRMYMFEHTLMVDRCKNLKMCPGSVILPVTSILPHQYAGRATTTGDHRISTFDSDGVTLTFTNFHNNDGWFYDVAKIVPISDYVSIKSALLEEPQIGMTSDLAKKLVETWESGKDKIPVTYSVDGEERLCSQFTG